MTAVCKAFAVCLKCGHIAEIPIGHIPVQCVACSGSMFACRRDQGFVLAVGEMNDTLAEINRTISESIGILSEMSDRMNDLTEAAKLRNC